MYQYQDMSPSEFEKLIIAICKEILGEGTQGFASGPDGGRDAKFNGIANLYPSTRKPWENTTIIQAKHTIGINKDFSEVNFYSATSNTNTLATEVKKIKTLFESGELNNYMLFSNRKLTGNKEPEIKQYISDRTGLNTANIAILGIDDLNAWLSRYSYIPNMVNLIPLTKSPTIRPDELREVIVHFSNTFEDAVSSHDFGPVDRTTYEEKNKINNMSSEFSKELEKNYMSYVYYIQEFLSDPQNTELQDSYQNAIEEFQFRFILPRKRELEYFDDIFNELVERLINTDYTLSQSKNVRLTRIMVFYMYWNCDIGSSQ